MYTALPPGPGSDGSARSGTSWSDADWSDTRWGVRRAVRLTFPNPACIALDEAHGARLDVYLTDLLQQYGLALRPGAPTQGGQSYGEMAEALVELTVPAGEEVDLLVLAYAIPDLTPGRATTTYLSHVCPGGPMAFAISDQGTGAAFTGLRLIQEYARSGGLRRALLIVVEQASLPYDPGVPVAIPAGHTGVALLLGDEAGARLGHVSVHTGRRESWVADEAGPLCPGATAILGAVLKDREADFGAAREVRIAAAEQPYTGVWWELAGTLADTNANAPGRRILLADADPALEVVGLAAIDIEGRESPLLRVEDYGRLAKDRIEPDVWDYIEGGAETERTVGANRRAFRRVSLRPRALVDVSVCDTRSELLGTLLRTPIGIAPTAYHRLVHPDGEVATARGASTAGALYVVSIFASRLLEEIAAAATSPLWLQLYWLHRREAMTGLIRRAESAGYRAIVLTVDTPRLGRRWRDERNGFAIGMGRAAVNLDPSFMASAHRGDIGQSAIAVHTAQAIDASVTWADLAWLRAQSDLPLVLKGILTAEDAARAVEHGAAAVIVSNHGGRQLDGAVASLDALTEVVDAVSGACPVLFDGGVRSGTDAFTALSLGAGSVLLGRPVLWGLAVDGAAGVAGVLGMATEELAHTMALAGRPRLTDLDRSATIRQAGR